MISDPRLEEIRLRVRKGRVHFSESQDMRYLLSLLDASERRITELEKTLALHGGEVRED